MSHQIESLLPIFITLPTHKNKALPTTFLSMLQTIFFIATQTSGNRKVLIISTAMACHSIIF